MVAKTHTERFLQFRRVVWLPALVCFKLVSFFTFILTLYRGVGHNDGLRHVSAILSIPHNTEFSFNWVHCMWRILMSV